MRPATAHGGRARAPAARRAARPSRPACGLLLAAACAVAAVPATAAPDAVPAQPPCGDAPGGAAPACTPRGGSSLLAPADGATLHGAGARFAWTRDAATRRRLQVARDDAFEDLVVDRGGIDAGEAIVALPPGDYRWRSVVEPPGAAAPPAADGACGEVRRFVLRPVPAAPAPEPPELRDGALTLRWPAGAPGDSYEAELARDPAFADVVARHAGAEPRMAVADPPRGFLYLRLRSVDAGGYAGPYGPAHVVEVPRTRWWRLLPLAVLWWVLLI